MKKSKSIDNCSNCKVGDLDKHVNVAGCPFYNPTQDVFCRAWKPLDLEDAKAPKITSAKSVAEQKPTE